MTQMSLELLDVKLTKSRQAVRPPLSTGPHDRRSDAGFSLVELVVVITIIAILTTIVVVGVRGVTDRGTETACAQERRVVAMAIESYFAIHEVDRLPGLPPVDGDQFERGLVSASVIRDVSAFYDVEADGSLLPESGSPCS